MPRIPAPPSEAFPPRPPPKGPLPPNQDRTPFFPTTFPPSAARPPPLHLFPFLPPSPASLLSHHRGALIWACDIKYDISFAASCSSSRLSERVVVPFLYPLTTPTPSCFPSPPSRHGRIVTLFRNRSVVTCRKPYYTAPARLISRGKRRRRDRYRSVFSSWTRLRPASAPPRRHTLPLLTTTTRWL